MSRRPTLDSRPADCRLSDQAPAFNRRGAARSSGRRARYGRARRKDSGHAGRRVASGRAGRSWRGGGGRGQNASNRAAAERGEQVPPRAEWLRRRARRRGRGRRRRGGRSTRPDPPANASELLRTRLNHLIGVSIAMSRNEDDGGLNGHPSNPFAAGRRRRAQLGEVMRHARRRSW